ncbi:hypothetical protein LIA77_07579 [Sarocladium implicatum]|nr:hypothetical protein LIA77_07579 [Sarocladium implicatum]
MYKLPYLWFGVASSLAGVCNSSPVGEDCTTDAQVVVELQPWKFICSGVTSSSTKTRTYTVPPCPEPTGPPGKPGQPTTVTVTVGCPEGESCNPRTIPPGPNCSGTCTATVVTTSSVPPGIPTTTTVTTGCPVDDRDCRPTTIPPPPGCTDCTATVITTPPATSAPPNTAPPTTRTITTGCPADQTSTCVPTTIPPPPGCTDCTATVITTPPPVSSIPSSTVPPTTRTITTGCPEDATSSCVPTTLPPSPGCTDCTATVITTPPATSAPPTSEPPGTTTTVTTVCLADDPDCRATTIPPPSTCTGTSTCTATVITISTSEPAPTPTESSTTSSEPSSTSSEPTSTSSEPPSPTFSCDAGGYLIQRRSLYRLNLESGANPLVSSNVGPSRGTNAIGYNVLDNYIWGVSQLANNWQLIRIDSEGGWKVYDTYIDTEAGWQAGDVGPDGHLYLWSANGAWREIDVNPDSATYRQELDRGVARLPEAGSIADWVYVEGGGRYLYSVQGLGGTSSTLVRWSMDTHQWETVRRFGNVSGSQQWGALYAVGNRFYGSENNNGEIWSFPVNGAGAAPELITYGPVSGANDGARCALAPAPSAGR